MKVLVLNCVVYLPVLLESDVTLTSNFAPQHVHITLLFEHVRFDDCAKPPHFGHLISNIAIIFTPFSYHFILCFFDNLIISTFLDSLRPCENLI